MYCKIRSIKVANRDRAFQYTAITKKGSISSNSQAQVLNWQNK